MEYIIVFCTVNNIENARLIGRKLLEEKLAACANIIPKLTSIYRWQGEIVEDDEVLMVIKTKQELFEDLQTQIKKLHPYEVPEIVAIDIKQGSKDYLDWIGESVK